MRSCARPAVGRGASAGGGASSCRRLFLQHRRFEVAGTAEHLRLVGAEQQDRYAPDERIQQRTAGSWVFEMETSLGVDRRRGYCIAEPNNFLHFRRKEDTVVNSERSTSGRRGPIAFSRHRSAGCHSHARFGQVIRDKTRKVE
jgi:hypothetical protein